MRIAQKLSNWKVKISKDKDMQASEGHACQSHYLLFDHELTDNLSSETAFLLLGLRN